MDGAHFRRTGRRIEAEVHCGHNEPSKTFSLQQKQTEADPHARRQIVQGRM